MVNEYGQRVYRKLLYFFSNKLAVHFTINETGDFYNGIILDLDERKLVMVLKEFKIGEMPFLLEDINEDSIVKFTTKEEKREQ